MQWSTHAPPKRRRSLAVGAAVIALTPACLVAWASMEAPAAWRNSMIALAIVEAFIAGFLLLRLEPVRVIVGVWLLLIYVVTFAALRGPCFDATQPNDHLRVALTLLMFGLLMVGREVRRHSGQIRRAKFLLKQLLARTEWPDHGDYHALPEVQALQLALQDNAAPALPYLAHDDRNIQLAVLAALAEQPKWRPGQPEIVLHYAYASEEPMVRAAAATALTRVTKSRHVNVLLTFMHDPYTVVRQAAAAAILADAIHRWPIIRAQVRAALANPNAAKDGPLPCSAQLPPLAIQDLLMWSGEAGPVGKRSTATVIRHCKQVINDEHSPEALEHVLSLVARSDVPAAIRVEVAHQLSAGEAFAPEVAAKLLDANQPTMLRLMAAGALLSQREEQRAIDVLREVARQPNREIALAAAGIIQKYLAVDVGLPVGGALPAPNTRQAAEVTRRVLEWATQDAVPSSCDGVAEGVGSRHSDVF